MAIKLVERVKISDVNELSKGVTFVAATSVVDGFKLDFMGKDFKTLILVEGGTAEGTITIKKGDGIQGAGDVTYTVGATGLFGITVDSGAFKQVTGENRGSVVVIPSSTQIKIALIELP